MDVITEKDHALMARVEPPLDGLVKDQDDWWLGWIALNKSADYAGAAKTRWPRFRKGGYNYPLEDPDMRFRADSFRTEAGAAAVGVVLIQPKEKRELWVGWVPAARSAEAAEWVSFLNDELKKLYTLWEQNGFAGLKKT